MKTICVMRDVFRALANFETAFEDVYQLSLNGAMILCALRETQKQMTATSLAKCTELSPSNTSKMLRILEEKKLIERTLGNEDKRLMYFNLTKAGQKKVEELELDKVKVPEILKPLF